MRTRRPRSRQEQFAARRRWAVLHNRFTVDGKLVAALAGNDATARILIILQLQI